MHATCTETGHPRSQAGNRIDPRPLGSEDEPDVSRERLPREAGKLPQKPTIAPDIAVEILSPGDRKRLLNEKIELYLANGARLVVVVDPGDRRVDLHEAGLPVAVFREGSIAATRAYPALGIDLAALFSDL